MYNHVHVHVISVSKIQKFQDIFLDPPDVLRDI